MATLVSDVCVGGLCRCPFGVVGECTVVFCMGLGGCVTWFFVFVYETRLLVWLCCVLALVVVVGVIGCGILC